MTAFYNRDPWNLIIGFGLLAALLYGIAVGISPWAVAGIFAYVAVSMLRRRLIRWDDLRRKGYFGGRQVRSLTLTMENTEPGHYELFLPTESMWQMAVPDWAKDRQREIVQRIAERLKPSDIHLSS